jgi:hypothetical protein
MTNSERISSRKGPALSRNLRSSQMRNGRFPKALPDPQPYGNKRKSIASLPSPFPEDDFDPLRSARGVLVGMFLGAGLWTAICVLILVWHPRVI